jgi:tetratricopeptide (TPR) repeat protein
MSDEDWSFESPFTSREASGDEKLSRLLSLLDSYAEKAKALEVLSLCSEYLENVQFSASPESISLVTSTASEVLFAQGRYLEASWVIDLALEKLEPWESFYRGFLYRTKVAVTEKLRGKESAILDAKTAISFFDSELRDEWAWPVRNRAARLLFETMKFTEALELLELMLSPEGDSEQTVVVGIACSLGGQSKLALGDFLGAKSLLERAFACLSVICHNELGNCLPALADVHVLEGNNAAALELLEGAALLEVEPETKIRILQKSKEILALPPRDKVSKEHWTDLPLFHLD